MRAWILDESPGQYRWGDIDRPTVGDHDVAVRPVASALNHMDLWLTRGRPRPPLPHVPGADVAGVVEAVGVEVDGVAVGDDVVVDPTVCPPEAIATLGIDAPIARGIEIVGEHRWGGHGEMVVVPLATSYPARPDGRGRSVPRRVSHHPSTMRQQPEPKWDRHPIPTTIGTSSVQAVPGRTGRQARPGPLTAAPRVGNTHLVGVIDLGHGPPVQSKETMAGRRLDVGGAHLRLQRR